MSSILKKKFHDKGFLYGIEVFSEIEITEYRKQFDKLEKHLGKETCQIGLPNKHFQ